MTVPPCFVCSEPGTITPIWVNALSPEQRKVAHLCAEHWTEWLNSQEDTDD